MRMLRLLFSLFLLIGISSMYMCNNDDDDDNQPDIVQTFKFYSSVFDSGQAIPTKYTCDSNDVSPPLHWEYPPTGTQSFVLIVDDPDASSGTWDHWIVFNIAASETSISEGASPNGNMPANAVQGKNSWGDSEYGGPCPPGGTHRYFFKLYALDTTLNLTTSADKTDVETAMTDHILEQKQIMGTYTR